MWMKIIVAFTQWLIALQMKAVCMNTTHIPHAEPAFAFSQPRTLTGLLRSAFVVGDSSLEKFSFNQ